MEKVTFSLPAMWADHHVLAVREALSRVTGVEEVLASAMYKDVLVKYDPASVNPEALKGVLAEAGYDAPPATFAELVEVASAITKTDFVFVSRAIMPTLLVYIILLFLISFFPALSTAVPNLLLGKV